MPGREKPHDRESFGIFCGYVSAFWGPPKAGENGHDAVWNASGFASKTNTGFHCIFVNLPFKPSLRDLVRYATLMPWMLAWVLSRVSFRGALMRWTLSLRAGGVKIEERIGSLRFRNSNLSSKRFSVSLSY